MMKDLNVPGAAVAVIKDGEMIISEGFGYRNLETKPCYTAYFVRNRFLNESFWHTFIKLISAAKSLIGMLLSVLYTKLLFI